MLDGYRLYENQLPEDFQEKDYEFVHPCTCCAYDMWETCDYDCSDKEEWDSRH